MDQLIELLQKIAELANVGIDALQGADTQGEGGPPPEGGAPPEAAAPPPPG